MLLVICSVIYAVIVAKLNKQASHECSYRGQLQQMLK